MTNWPETGNSTVPSGGGVPFAPRVKAKSNSGSAAAIGPYTLGSWLGMYVVAVAPSIGR